MNKTIRQQIYDKFLGKCAYTGRPLADDWQIDHKVPKYMKEFISNFDIDGLDNLYPALKIVNHYKRGLDIDDFRRYMTTFHKRLAKLPKNPYSPNTIRRKEYMYKVADAFGITPDNPFCGKFYFETLK